MMMTKEEKAIKKSSGRIWELDFIRGLAIIGVIFIHAVFDINYNFRVFDHKILAGNPIFDGLQIYGSLIFIVLSGICLTLGKKSVRRGLIVLGGGILVSIVIFIGIKLGMLSKYEKIDFGILSCLGLCMLAATPFRKVNKFGILCVAIVFIALGLYFDTVKAANDYLAFLGIRSVSYYAGDYFPFVKNFGYYMVGVFLGKLLYKDKRTLLPFFSDKTPVINAVCFIGRNTLWIYLAHQPLIFGLLWLFFPLR